MGKLEEIIENKESKEIEEFIKAYCELKSQIKNPTRDGTIKALSDAQKVAYNEIAALERSQGNIYRKPWSDFSTRDLLRKLPQYMQGLNNHAVKKFGEETFKHLLEEHIKANQNQ